MPTDAAKPVSGIEMTDEEIEEYLYENGHGVLSLTDGGETYGLPMSFGYDGDRAFMQVIQFGNDSKKRDFIDTTERANLCVYEVDTRFKWKSVIVNGELSVVPEEEIEYAEEQLDDNGWFPTIFPPTDPMSGVDRVALEVDEMTGRKGQEYQD